MTKLLTLNVEGRKHYPRVLHLLETEKPTIVCLQELPEEFMGQLRARGYLTSFLPMFIKTDAQGAYAVGIGIASTFPFFATGSYYHRGSKKIVPFDPKRKRETSSFGFIASEIKINSDCFRVVTTHLVDTEHGQTNPFQTELLGKLLTKLHQLPPHLICGDFNVPRGFNSLYPKITKFYADAIPKHYQSSLDRSLHRLGTATLDEPIFEKYMVDYIFTKPPYTLKTVGLRFGVSDHAAVVAELNETK